MEKMHVGSHGIVNYCDLTMCCWYNNMYMCLSFFHWQPAEPQRPASFGSEEDFPVDSILATMLKEDKSEEDKQNGWFNS